MDRRVKWSSRKLIRTSHWRNDWQQWCSPWDAAAADSHSMLSMLYFSSIKVDQNIYPQTMHCSSSDNCGGLNFDDRMRNIEKHFEKRHVTHVESNGSADI